MAPLSVYEVVFTLTERVLLLLGWDKVKGSKHEFTRENEDAAYSKLKKTNQALRKRLERCGVESEDADRPTKASWEQNTPQLRHVTCATTSSLPSYAEETWTSGNAFDAAATGTV